MYKNALHILELLGVSPGFNLCPTVLNIAKYLKTLRCGGGAVAFIFSIYLKPVLYMYTEAAIHAHTRQADKKTVIILLKISYILVNMIEMKSK